MGAIVVVAIVCFTEARARLPSSVNTETVDVLRLTPGALVVKRKLHAN
jgi:hypothetical protein